MDRRITPSPELVAVVNRWNKAVRVRDTRTIENLLSEDAALHYIGTAAKESWRDAVLRHGIADHFGEVPEFHYGESRVTAFEVENTGWATWEGDIFFPSTDVVLDYRITFVFVLEHGAWKIIHFHLSNPTPNFEKLGIEHSALDALVAAARDGTLGVGRAGMASVMFTDVVDSSALADMMGDRLWSARIDGHLSAVRKIVEDADGTLVKSLGDGTMSTFSSARAALRAACEIQQTARADTQEPVLRLRIGLHTGEVIENKGDFFGTVVNKAARINAAAAPDEIRLSDATKMMLGRTDDFTIDDPQEVALKGIEGQHLIYRLGY